MTESSISRERALAILELMGEADAYIPGADYWVVIDDDGDEALWMWGDDEPMAVNPASMSWLGSGMPH